MSFFAMSYLAFVLPAAAIVLFVWLGLRAGRGIDSADDSFLTGGRGFGPAVLAFSIFATSNTGFMFVGAIGAGFKIGVAALWVPVAWFAGEVVFWLRFPERIHAVAQKRNPVSIPDYISRAVPEGSRRPVQVAAGLVIVFATLPYLLGQNIAAGKAFSVVSGFDLQTSVLVAGSLVTCVALLYCARGGLKSSMLANTVQGIFILVVSSILLLLVVYTLLASPDAVDTILANNPRAFDPFSVHVPLIAFVFFLGAATASFGSAMSLPTLLMRVTVAGSKKDLDRARWWYLGICYGFWGLMSAMGLALSGIVSSIDDPEQALFLFAERQSPFMLGLTLAGVTALILSTIDGSTMVGGSALSDDIGRAGERRTATRRVLRVGGLVIFAASSLICAIFLADASVYDVVLFGVSALAGGIGPAFMISTLGWPTHAHALVTAIVLGALTAVIWAALGLADIVAEALPAFAVGLASHWAVMRLKSPSKDPVRS
ncbi:MAG: hypothetical protein AAF337_08735 [Pseudomonadota bacterium]